MNLLLTGAAAVAILGAVSVYNYRRFVPKPTALGTEDHEIEIRTLAIPANGHTLYGELLLPKGKSAPLPTVICCHGYASSYRACKNSIGLSLAKSGFAAICFDFYGGGEHCRSGGSMQEMSIFTEQLDLEAVIAFALKLDSTDPANLFLLGQSQGGCVSAITAPQFAQQIRALILHYPAFCIPDDARKKYTSVQDIPPTEKHFGHTISRIYSEHLLRYDVYAASSGYDRPVLILHGDADKMVPVSYSQRAASNYSNAVLQIFPGEPHGFTAAGKQKAAKITYDFLKKNLV